MDLRYLKNVEEIQSHLYILYFNIEWLFEFYKNSEFILIKNLKNILLDINDLYQNILNKKEITTFNILKNLIINIVSKIKNYLNNNVIV